MGRTQGPGLNKAAAASGSISKVPSQENQLVTGKNIVRTISRELGLTQQQAQQIVQKMFVSIVNMLVEDGRVEIRNFGGIATVRWWPCASRPPGIWA